MTVVWGDNEDRVGHAGLVIASLLILALCGAALWFFGYRLSPSSSGLEASDVEIQFWYGPVQTFGSPGRAQRWINVLGNVQPSREVTRAWYTLDDGPRRHLSLGSDQHRLALDGDFNVDLPWEGLSQGEHTLSVGAELRNGVRKSEAMKVNVILDRAWPLPVAVDFSGITDLQAAVQVVDGHWSLGPDGVRTVSPFYDRVVCLGDTTWSDYESEVLLTIHAFTPPAPGPPTYQVTHFGVAMRWNGHHQDEFQPHRKWYPLGAQGEFLIKKDPGSSQWRLLLDQSEDKPLLLSPLMKSRDLGQPIRLRTRVETQPDGRTRYRFRKWGRDGTEPTTWDAEAFETNDERSGALCLVAHNTDVTIHRVEVRPLTEQVKE